MVDIDAQIEAVSRSFRTETIDGERSNVQTIAQEYPAGIHDTWEAVTTADRLARWFLPVTGELRLGGRYQLEGNAGGEVLECHAPAGGTAGFLVTWESASGVSRVRVRLTARGDERTYFELEHTANAADLPTEWWETYGPGATGVGWDQVLLGLALHLGSLDGAIAREDAMAWTISGEGKAFSRASADRWAAAHVAAGADREAAQRSADATYGFYTGDGAM